MASLLGRMIGVPVGDVRLGHVDGRHGMHAVSLLGAAECMEYEQLRQIDEEGSPKIEQALKDASGLLPFTAWIEWHDLKNEHLIAALLPEGAVRFYGIDFAFSFDWHGKPDMIMAHGIPVLCAHKDAGVIKATVGRIEAVAKVEIETAFASLPDSLLSSREKQDLVAALLSRQGMVRETMRQKGWLP